jgi:hypothetical protein
MVLRPPAAPDPGEGAGLVANPPGAVDDLRPAWDAYFRAWAEQEGLHAGGQIVRGLDARFTRRFHAEGPNYFADLANTTETEEQAAIDAGLIRPGGIRYAATRP